MEQQAAPAAASPGDPLAPPPPLSSDDRLFATLCHLLALTGYVVPFGNIAGPLIVWLLKRETSPFIDGHGKEALNFQISILIYAAVAGLLILALVGCLLLPAVAVFKLVCVIIAAVRASEGQPYRYPLSIRFIA
jgi:uncharacterized Tic20 family protein